MLHHRKLKRIELIAALDVFDTSREERLGVLIDITTEGLGVKVRERPVLGETYGLRVRLPTVIQGVEAVDVQAKCAWCAETDNPALFRCGFQFLEILPDTIEVIEELIRRFKK